MKKTLPIIVVGAIAVIALYVGLSSHQPNSTATAHPVLGALSSPSINSPWLRWGGITHWAGHTDALNNASTTLCAIQSPAATSTFTYGDLQLSVGTSTTLHIDLSMSPTPSATSTVLGATNHVSTPNNPIVASTSPSGGPPYVFPPNYWFIATYTGAAGALNVLQGDCQASWTQS